jgi:putative hemolysin
VQVGITLIGIVAGAYSGATLAGPLADVLRGVAPLAPVADTLAFVLVVAATTYLSLIAGELVPKRLAMQNAEGIAALVAGPMDLLARIGRPLVWFLRVSTEGLLRLLRVRPNPESTVTEDEVKAMIAEGTQSGVFEESERRLLEGVLRFADRPVRTIMVPRREIVWLPAARRSTGFSTRSATAGTPASRSATATWTTCSAWCTSRTCSTSTDAAASDLNEILRAPLFVSEDMPSLKLLDQFRSSRLHMAVALDEYGALQGIVTPVDILTSIAGDLPEGREREGPSAVQREDGSWLVDGGCPRTKSPRFSGSAGFDTPTTRPSPAMSSPCWASSPRPATPSPTAAGASRWSTWTAAASTRSCSPA